MSFFIYLYDLCLKVYFVCYEYCYLQFIVISICKKYLFPSLFFQFTCAFLPKGIICRQHIIRSCFLIQSATLYLSIGAFSPLTFKVIIDRYVFIAFLNLVFQVIICFFFVPFFLIFAFPFWFDEFLLYVCLCSVLFGFCESIECFWFVFVKYVNPLLYLLALV